MRPRSRQRSCSERAHESAVPEQLFPVSWDFQHTHIQLYGGFKGVLNTCTSTEDWSVWSVLTGVSLWIYYNNLMRAAAHYGCKQRDLRRRTQERGGIWWSVWVWRWSGAQSVWWTAIFLQILQTPAGEENSACLEIQTWIHDFAGKQSDSYRLRHNKDWQKHTGEFLRRIHAYLSSFYHFLLLVRCQTGV